MSFERERDAMVREQLQRRGIGDARVLAAFLSVPRHAFVPAEFQQDAYADHPIPIGGGQTISQPYMVALMTELLRLHGHERVLEVGTGSGYQAAILAELALEVYTIERVPELAAQAARRLEELGTLNVRTRCGDGRLGWSEVAPFDAILVAAAAPAIPPPLFDQLALGGRLVAPVGSTDAQRLMCYERRPEGYMSREVTRCVFVPLVEGAG